MTHPAPHPQRYDWTRLNKLQVGRYAEYFTKMEFTLHGFDVDSAEVDDKGIDFVVRRDAARYYDVQVKALRGNGYAYMRKATFEPRETLLPAVVLLDPGTAPELFLIPSLAWTTAPSALLVGRDYVGRASAPEWGLSLSGRTRPLLGPYRFDQQSAAL
jgi:hypothetical protein